MLGATCRVLHGVPGATCRVPGAVQGAGCPAPGAECLVPRAWCCAGCSGGSGFAPRAGMGAKRYEDLVAWQLANELKRGVYELVARSDARGDRRFCDQITASAASAPGNLAEGFGCYRHPEFARYVRIAKASLLETHNHLGDGIDRRHWSPRDVSLLLELTNRAVGACVRLLAYLEATDAPGLKPRRRR